MKALFTLALVFVSPIAALTYSSGKAIAKSPGCDPEIHVCSYSQSDLL
ncbi:MAG: hypothetical protein AAF289_14335 [Cyanobacteria bacterium P01_A01_bin.135]